MQDSLERKCQHCWIVEGKEPKRGWNPVLGKNQCDNYRRKGNGLKNAQRESQTEAMITEEDLENQLAFGPAP